jgi:TolA-binding protein
MVAASASGAFGQTPTPTQERVPGATKPSADFSKQRTEPGARRIPDALKFANGLLRQKKYDMAAEEFERFLKLAPGGRDDVDARFGLATCRLYQGRYPDALHAFEEFLKVARDDPRRMTARYRLGELSYLLGDLPAARRSLEEFTSIQGEHAGLELAWTYLGDTCFGLDDLPNARKAYERSLSAYPRGRMADRARYGLGRTLAAQGEVERALDMLQALARNGGPDWVDRAWLQIGLIRKSAGQFAEALDAFNALKRTAPLSPLRPEAELQRGLVLIRVGRTAEAETDLRALAASAHDSMGPRAALELATIQLEQNHPETASTTLEDAMKRFPKSPATPVLLFRSAEALQRRNKLAEARARFLRVVEADPRDPWADDALERAAQAALEGGEPAIARSLAGSFATKFPGSPLKAQVRLIEARAAAQTGNPKEAAAILESLLKPGADASGGQESSPASGAPDFAQAARYELAAAYRTLGQAARSEAILAEVAKSANAPIAADASFLLGQGHLDAGRLAQAIAPLEHYLAAKPAGDVADFALAHLVTAQLGLGQLDAACKTLADLTKRFPHSKALAPTRLRAAETALAARQADRAIELFRLVAGTGTEQTQAKQSGAAPGDLVDLPLRIRGLAGQGNALLQLGKPADAAAAFAALLELAPGDPIAPEIAFARGRALEAAHQPAEALRAYLSILERFAKSDQAPQAALAHARLLDKTGRHADAAHGFERLFSDRAALERLQAAGVGPDSLLMEWGRALLDCEKTADADRIFTRVLDEYPDSRLAAEARLNLAESANASHNHAEVVRLLTPVVKSAARSTDTNRNSSAKSQAGQDSGPDSPAADPLRRLLPSVLYRLGRTQVEINDWTAAVATLDRLLTEFPESPYRREALYLRAESAFQTGDAADAESRFSAFLKEPSSTSDAKGLIHGVRLKRIHCWIVLKRWKDALEGATALKSGLPANDPAAAELNFATGQALLGLGRLAEARTAFQTVVDAHPGAEMEARALLMCGETHFHQEHFQEALRIFLKVDILYDAPRWQAASLLEAGKVYERLDQWADAAETYERLLTRFPKEPAADEARDRRTAASRRAAATNSARKG